MPKDSLRDKLEDNELDLSLNNLALVPVKELATIPKATHLDLSCNVIVSLPDNFCTLTHLVKIDLSKNELGELPDDFGDLHNLQHLDLLGNKLTMLPVSFYKLRKLKWLDLKDNPLIDDLKKVAGDCLDELQCKKCAQQVVEYMRRINSEMERIRQKKLQEEREKEAAIKAAEEAIISEKREQRKAAKQRKKQEKNKPQQKEISKETINENISKPEINGKVPNKEKLKTGSGWFSVKNVVLTWMVLLFAICIGIIVFCYNDPSQQYCTDYFWPVTQFCTDKFSPVAQFCSNNFIPVANRTSVIYNYTLKYVSQLYTKVAAVVSDMLFENS